MFGGGVRLPGLLSPFSPLGLFSLIGLIFTPPPSGLLSFCFCPSETAVANRYAPFARCSCSVGPPWQADHPRVAILHAYSHLATNFRNLQARFNRDTLAALPLEKLAYFRPPFTSEAHSLEDFLQKPEMSWGYEGVGETSGRRAQAEGDGGVAAQLLSIEAMQRRGTLGEEEAAAAKRMILGLPKL